MEKDSFESKLQQMVLKTDQQPAPRNYTGQERVWAKVRRKKNNGKWWISAAAVLITCFGLWMLMGQKQPPQTKPELVADQKVNPVQSPVAIPAITNGNEKTVVRKSTLTVKKQEISVDTVVQSSAALSPRIDAIKSAVVPPQEIQVATVAVSHTAAPDPEVTVQFKRGKTIEPEESTIKVSIRKFKFKASSSYYAEGEEEKKSALKIKF